MNHMELYDLIVIGGGPGGYNAAERAARAGLKTLLFEKRALGGVCLNEGCIPSKALLNSAKTYEHALHATAYGVTCGNVSINQESVVARKAKVVRTLVSGVRAKMKHAGVTVIMEEAMIVSKDNNGFIVSADGKTYTGKHLIIATGSSNAIPPLPGIKENLGNFVLTNREVLELKDIPKEFVVIGGGVSANSYLRAEAKRRFENSEIELVIPPLWCTTDNAAMIAKAAHHMIELNRFAGLDMTSQPDRDLEEESN